MRDEEIKFPDLDSFEIIHEGANLEDVKQMYKFYIVEVDIFVPSDLQFIPVSFKIPNEGGCFYMYGEHRNQHFCDVDLSEAIKVGCVVTKIHQGLGFTRQIENFLSVYTKEMCNM